MNSLFQVALHLPSKGRDFLLAAGARAAVNFLKVDGKLAERSQKDYRKLTESSHRFDRKLTESWNINRQSANRVQAKLGDSS